MPDLDRNLYDQLRSQAAAVDVPAGDVHAVMARGRHRRRGRVSASMLALTAAAATVTGLVVSNLGGTRPTEVSVGAASPPAAADAQLTWRVVPARAGLSMLTGLSTSGSVAYAVSTAPGVVGPGNEPAPQLYRSADGLSWTTATGPTGVSDAGVAVDGNRIYTVGTGPATAATGVSGVSGAETTAVSWSDDGGGSWQNSVLPVELSAPAGTLTIDEQGVNVAAGSKGVVAVVSVNATADLSKLVPGASAKTLWTANANGIEVLGSEISSQCGFNSVTLKKEGLALRYGAAGLPSALALAKQKAAAAQRAAAVRFGKTLVVQAPEGQLTTVPCGNSGRSVPADQAYRVVRTYSWSQLNLGGQAEQALLGEPLVFFSTNGTDFHQVTLPAGIYGQVSVTATPSGFALVASGIDGPPVVLQSVDGQHWTPTPFPLPASATGATGIGYAGGHLVVIGADQTATVSYTLLSGGWQATPLDENVMAVSFGPLGVGVVGVAGNGYPGPWQVQFSRDGLQWSKASLASVSGGAVENANVVVGANQVVVTITRPPTGPGSAALPVQVQAVGTLAR